MHIDKADEVGELVYRRPNVMMGFSESAEIWSKVTILAESW